MDESNSAEGSYGSCCSLSFLKNTFDYFKRVFFNVFATVADLSHEEELEMVREEVEAERRNDPLFDSDVSS